MKTVKIILDFLITLTSIFFRSRRKSKPCKPLADTSGQPLRLPAEHRSGSGSHRRDTLAQPTDAPMPPDAPSATNLFGWALIVAAAGGQVLKYWL